MVRWGWLTATETPSMIASAVEIRDREVFMGVFPNLYGVTFGTQRTLLSYEMFARP
jgi:hypothetical protein